MKKLLFALIGLVALISVGSIAFKLGQSSGTSTVRFAAEIEEWTAVVGAGRSPNAAVTASICTNLDCGFGCLLRLWHALDSTHRVYQQANQGKVSVLKLSKEQLRNVLTESSRTYIRLLPVLHGALEALGLRFEDYLAMRKQLAKTFGGGETNEFARTFVYSVGQQAQALDDIFRTTDASAESKLKFTDYACRDLLLDYLRKGQHMSADEEHWIGIDGPSRLAILGSKGSTPNN